MIIEFAKDLQAQGKGLIESAPKPLICVPSHHHDLDGIRSGCRALVSFASGAGSASQRAIGTGVLGGMVTALYWQCFCSGVLRGGA